MCGRVVTHACDMCNTVAAACALALPPVSSQYHQCLHLPALHDLEALSHDGGSRSGARGDIRKGRTDDDKILRVGE